jgi:hypothetical protein
MRFSSILFTVLPPCHTLFLTPMSDCSELMLKQLYTNNLTSSCFVCDVNILCMSHSYWLTGDALWLVRAEKSERIPRIMMAFYGCTVRISPDNEPKRFSSTPPLQVPMTHTLSRSLPRASLNPARLFPDGLAVVNWL